MLTDGQLKLILVVVAVWIVLLLGTLFFMRSEEEIKPAKKSSINLLRSEEPPRSIIFLRLSHEHC